MDVALLQKQYLHFGNSMYKEGYLDEQFVELQKLADESEPGFVLEIISIFFNDSDRILHNLSNELEKPDLDLNQIADMAQMLKGSSLSIGAKKLKDVCITFKIHCEERNLQGCIMCLQQVKQEYTVIRSKLETLLSMQKQIMAANGTVPVIELTEHA